MDYASPDMYKFKYYISRYDHSLNVALVTWRLTHDKKQTLASLFHDISAPVFSHAVDYMNRDYITQESTEDKTMEILLSSKELLQYLKEDEVDIEDLINFKSFSVVDLKRPALCADRLENLIGAGMSWVKLVDLDIAQYITYINDCINRLTHTNEDIYMMNLLGDIIRTTIESGYITYDDLYRLTEHEYMKIIEDNIPYNYELADMWEIFKNIKEVTSVYNIEVKEMTLDPIVDGKRLSQIKKARN